MAGLARGAEEGPQSTVDRLRDNVEVRRGERGAGKKERKGG